MSDLIAQLEALSKSPPSDPAARSNLYRAARKLLAATEDPFNTICRVNGAPMILTFAQVACNLGLFKKLAEAPIPLSTAFLASFSGADTILLSRILRFLASMDMIAEVGEDEFTSNNVTHILARPGFQAGIAHTFMVVMPCLQVTPKFLADTGYRNPTDVLFSPFQVAHKTDKPAYAWAMDQPELMADFNLWMTEQHRSQKTWLDVFDFAAHIGDSMPETLLMVDVGGGLGQQCALFKKTHPEIPGRVVLQDQPFVLPHAISINGVETQAYDFWTEQPLQGARVYYMRNILEDYPDTKALSIIRNILPALSPNSVLIIDEMIIPNSGANARSTVQDMIMMTSLASAERTEKQWNALLDQAGLKVIQKTAYRPETGESIIVAVPN
ncbi:S-adenosyl-L-methionine-dependent methyltransferase [Annulohypoxylon truncatum]|uniref:S-adenosyl-L-methionine-dependent methyltransferase n=1 Tax=Annulohypoxylon truncatum TaxID=327061 RepID=UPI0020073B35|nr:S-adenosyl-L-methionine-dependent methyltransferase [Annulohypoxylon truncatum]KAI1213215.1 S-adenosyl-L-methionine-dependent methyltransferase [Annulohypoxylon truncatum]